MGPTGPRVPTPGFAAGWSFGQVHSLGPFLGLLPVLAIPTSDPSTPGWSLGGVGVCVWGKVSFLCWP